MIALRNPNVSNAWFTERLFHFRQSIDTRDMRFATTA
jgi:hypothetical protein